MLYGPDHIVRVLIAVDGEDTPLLALSITKETFVYFLSGGLDAMIVEMGEGIVTAAKELEVKGN
ncbi:hypothetical protein LCGC14_1682250 [marine sediment metagenome]|uniref:Uncharacterized protein n=1 Tax=marine sediment metagenome TaxID=412755 RepID=A0A0F9KN98_9ZZZZ